jgi:hypothetical protein
MGGVDVEAVDRVAVPLEEVGGGSDGLEEGGGAIGGQGPSSATAAAVGVAASVIVERLSRSRRRDKGRAITTDGNRCCRPKRVLQ